MLTKFVILLARVHQKIGDDVVQPLGFAAHDVHEHLLFFVQGGHLREHLHRTRYGREWVSNLVRDA